MREIYLDNSATTRVFPEVAELMTRQMCENYGNPSSMHHKGVEAEKVLRNSKEMLAGILKCDTKNIYFTSGGTESDNMALCGVASAMKRKGMHLITTQIEHPAILNTMKHLEEEGYSVTYLPVDKLGHISLSDLKNAITLETILVSVMHTNNEIGAVQDIAAIGALIKECNPDTLFHTDAVQGFGKAVIIPKKMGIDLMSVSSHKIHGPKGMGILYVGDKVKINPIVFGGGQQNGLRSGTENIPGIAGMAMASDILYRKIDDELEKLWKLKERLIDGALKIEGVTVNGVGDDGVRRTAPHIVSLSFEGVRAEVLLHTLENEGIYVSAGSACSTHKPEPSATLKAIGLDKNLLDSTLRFSMSVFTTEEDIDTTLKVLENSLPMLRRFSRR